jgi:hypothetical protein
LDDRWWEVAVAVADRRHRATLAVGRR